MDINIKTLYNLPKDILVKIICDLENNIRKEIEDKYQKEISDLKIFQEILFESRVAYEICSVEDCKVYSIDYSFECCCQQCYKSYCPKHRKTCEHQVCNFCECDLC